MLRKRLVGMLVGGLIFMFLNAQAFIGQDRVSAQTPVIDKPYLVGLDRPATPQGQTESPLQSIVSSDTQPNYLEWHNYVYQTAFYPDYDWEIAFRQGYGSPTMLTSNTREDIDPDLNLAGTAIVFSTDRNGQYDLYSMNTSGGSLLRLTTDTHDEYSPHWSPDNSQMVYVSEKNGVPEIFRMNANGSGQTRLTVLPPYGDFDPSFSPDGSQIAFVRQETDLGGRIWVMNADGSDPHAITSYMLFPGHPAWSPDGSLIAFDGDVDADVWNELVTIHPDGSELTEVYDFGSDNVDIWMGNWSADMKYILFTRVGWTSYDMQSYINSMHSYMFKLEGGTLTSDPAESNYAGSPDWFRTDNEAPVTALKPLPEYSTGYINLDWDYQDSGSSGLHGVQLQYRNGLDGTWTNVTTALQAEPPYAFNPGGCGPVYFRARGEDHAENWEEWPESDYEVSTKRYSNAISGNITDNHGIPLPEANLIFNPVPLEPITLDPLAQFSGYLCNWSNETITISHPGLGQWTRTTFPPANPTLLTNHYLPPTASAIANGEFIGTISQWTRAGDFLAQVVNLPYANALRFGGSITLTPTEEAIYNLDITPPRTVLRIDSEGGRHAVWMDRDFNPATAYYAYKPAGGVWTAPLAISDPGITTIGNLDMEIDAGGNLHVAWVRTLYVSGNYYDHVIYRMRSSAGEWSPELDISDALTTGSYSPQTYPEVLMDTTGRAHLLWGTSTGIIYRLRQVDGTWNTKVTIDTGFIKDHFSATIGPDHTVHVMYTKDNSPYGTYFARKLDGASWTAPSLMATYPVRVYERDSLAVQQNGKLLSVWHDDINHYSLFYQEMDETGVWGPIQIYPSSSVYPIAFVKLDASRKPFLFLPSGSSFGIATRGVDGNWYQIAGVNHAVKDCIFNESDLPECVYKLKTFVVSIPPTVSTTVSQTVTIPADLINPTLAFNYSFTHPAGANQFHVLLGGEEIFSTPPEGQMVLGSVDVSDWKGQTVPLSFETSYVPLEGKFETYLYNVSLGSWSTPSISAVSPGRFFDAWEGEVITISGQNFIDPVTVKLNEVDVPGVVFVDSGTLQVTLPPGLPAGVYTLTVTNPGGQTALKINALRLGPGVFIPMIIK